MKQIYLFLIIVIFLCNLISSYNYVNSSLGFKLSSYGMADPRGIAYNGSDYWILDRQDYFVYHINSTFSNQSDGFKTTVGISTQPENMCMKNSTTLWIMTNSGGTARATQMDLDGTNGTASISLNGAGIVNGIVPCTSNDSDLWVTDNLDKWVYHFDKNLNNASDGFSISELSNPSGIVTMANNEFFIGDVDKDFMFHFINGVNQTDGFGIGTMGIGEIRSLAKNNYDLLVIDNQDIAVYYLQAQASIILNNPSDDYNTLDTNVTFKCSINGTAIYNVSLMHNISGVWQRNQTRDYSSSLQANQIAMFNVTKIPIGNNYGWTCEVADSPDGAGASFITSYSLTNYTFNISIFIQNSISYNTTAYETEDNLITLNITTNGTIPTAKLFYNGTNKGSAVVTTYGGNSFIINKTANVIQGEGNTTFYFEINVGGSLVNTSNYQQKIIPIYFAQCNSTLTIPYLNITFKDEENSTSIAESIPYSYFEYYLGSNASNNKTYTYVNNTENKNYTFCFSPQNKTINLNPYVQYTRANYYQRTYNPLSTQYSNKTNETILYSILQSSSQAVTFQVLNSADQPISGVSANVTRLIGSTLVIVGEGTTGSDGGVTFYLSPSFSHTFSFYKSGYEVYTTSLVPTQSSYTISLGGTSSTTSDYSQGITYLIKPLLSEYLINDTTYNFNFTLNSTYWDVSEFGFYLSLPNGSILQSTSSSSNGGIVNRDQNTNSFSKIYMNYYWIVNSTYTNGSVSWIVLSDEDTKYSIANFFNKLNITVAGGIFGIDYDLDTKQSFSLTILVFLFIFIFTGIVSYKFGMSNPTAIGVIVFCLVAFFDVVLGLMINPVNAVPHFPTILIAILLIGLLFREVYR
jgi:hypothetical protein